MPIKLNGATSGSVELGVPDVVGSDVQNVLLPSTAGTLDRLERSGNIVQVQAATPVYDGSLITCTKDTSSSASQFGLIASRAYADLLNVTITPQAANNTLIFLANVGYTSGVQSSRGAHGIVIVRDNTLGLEVNGNYPWYDATGGKIDYAPPDYVVATYSASNTNAQTWYLKSFCYNEEAGSSSETLKCISRSFVVLEVAA
jgi:hypothetical protein